MMTKDKGKTTCHFNMLTQEKLVISIVGIGLLILTHWEFQKIFISNHSMMYKSIMYGQETGI